VGGGGGLESGWVLVGSGEHPNNGGGPSLMGARPHSERAPKNNGGAPSSCGRFGDFLLFFIAAKS
jgi:hypothetical protein